MLCFITTSLIGKDNNPICTKRNERFKNRLPVTHWGHPYTLFDRSNSADFNLDSDLSKVRNRIIPLNNLGDVIQKSYYDIVKKADEGIPSDNGMPRDKVSELAQWAYFNAFVLLIGVDSNGVLITDLNVRGKYKNNVLNAFDKLSDKIRNSNGKLQFSGKSLMMWLQAYDLLKATAACSDLQGIKYFNNFDSDRNNDNWCSPRNKLRKLTRDFYEECDGLNGVITGRRGWKKNH